MTFMRHFHRNAWCSVCRDLTPHDEDGKGLCMHCQWDIQEWLDRQDAPQPQADVGSGDKQP